MGLDLIYTSGDASLVTRFSTVDWQILDRLRADTSDAIAAMVDVHGLDGGANIACNLLREAVEQIDRLLGDRPELLPYIYQFRCENFVVQGQRIECDYSSGGMSGLRLLGNEESYFAIRAGLDECRLDEMVQQPDGTLRVVNQRDLRNEYAIHTSNVGTIKIRRRRAKTGLRRALSSIRNFLANLPDGARITKVVC